MGAFRKLTQSPDCVFNIFYILALKGGGSSKIYKVSKEIYLISKLTHISVKTRTNCELPTEL